ncbi:hypothetical protein NUH88_07720 [Nisaea acidiphila]|uniref:Uncharacterized protein n=1 Tax=Nisaea acidiphila TaxID=1862145 RepID=A0A9J7AW94_9PROT|nr:hypothetical protein [Nisaea acidiphila]UUX51576.1 hypothetical protein NUH88_07720 [Nisaea acidiphila]
MSEERENEAPPVRRRGEFILSGEVGRWQRLGRMISTLWRWLFPGS